MSSRIIVPPVIYGAPTVYRTPEEFYDAEHSSVRVPISGKASSIHSSLIADQRIKSNTRHLATHFGFSTDKSKVQDNDQSPRSIHLGKN